MILRGLAQQIVLITGFVNLMLCVVELGRPDLWERFWKHWIRHPWFRLHGLLLLALAAVFALALPVDRLEFFLWISIVLLVSVGGVILTRPASFLEPMLDYYLNPPQEAPHRLTYLDALFRAAVGLALIFSVRG